MPDMSPVRLPDDTHRLVNVGRTGTGKTVISLWHLSRQYLRSMAWLIYDFKGDEHINSIERAEHVDTNFIPKPRDTGIFIVHPRPKMDDKAVEAQMWALWKRQNVGIYVDEAYMIDNDAQNAILTQGRSRHIPMIINTQRPVWLSQFVFSEADFYHVLQMNRRKDREIMEGIIDIDEGLDKLPEHHSYYYDVSRDQVNIFKPVPETKVSLAAIGEQLRPRRRVV